MGETAGIYALVRRARRRLRWQAAFEWATTASILGSAAALVIIYMWRRDVIGLTAAQVGLGCSFGILVVGGIAGALRRFPTAAVASRIDRASGLADRLTTAVEFEGYLAAGQETHPETRELMAAAVRDAVRCLPRANVVKATPFAPPRDLQAASLFLMIATAVGGLYFGGGSGGSGGRAGVAGTRQRAERSARGDRTDPPVEIEDDDLFYSRDLLEELRRTAERTEDEHLETFVKEIDELLAKAERGEISKEQLLEELARAEKGYMEGADEKVEQTAADLKESGKELQKDPLTRELGKALEKGDMATAKQELEKLAEQIDKDELKPEQREKLAKALEKTAEKFEKKDQQREQKAAQEAEKKQQEVRRLQKKHDESKDPEDKRRLAQRLEKEKRELKRLERDQQQQEQSAQKRHVKRLHRNMKEAAQDMRQQDQQKRRQASRKLKQGAEDMGQVDQEMKRVANQKQVASQMGDLKEALRRAKRQKGGGKDQFGKNARNQDFQRRAGGGKGSRQSWRPGQQGGKEGRIADQAGRGQPGNQPGQPGNQPGQGQDGDQPGDQHDPNLLGDPTAKTGQTVDEQLQGLHGKGPSRRETILAAAQKGFASRAYGKVYAEYRTIVEEVIRAEKVPSGYKYYVKRYFQKIKPHAMD